MCDLLVYLDVLNTFVPEDHLFLHNMLHFIIPCNKLQGFFLLFLHFFGQFFFFLSVWLFQSDPDGSLLCGSQTALCAIFLYSHDARTSVSPALFCHAILPVWNIADIPVDYPESSRILQTHHYAEPRHQSGNRIDHDHCRKLASCQDIISDGDIICNNLFQHTLIKTLIMPAQRIPNLLPVQIPVPWTG